VAGPLPPDVHAVVRVLAGPYLARAGRLAGCAVSEGTRAAAESVALSWYRDGYAGQLVAVPESRVQYGEQVEPSVTCEIDALCYAARSAGYAARQPRVLSPVAVLGLAALHAWAAQGRQA
jgi:hypothetical protein